MEQVVSGDNDDEGYSRDHGRNEYNRQVKDFDPVNPFFSGFSGTIYKNLIFTFGYFNFGW